MRETDLDKLNKLIDWYEQNKPTAGQEILTTHTPEKLCKMLGIPRPAKGDWPTVAAYRGRKILAGSTHREPGK
jgi:hypothetical protein